MSIQNENSEFLNEYNCHIEKNEKNKKDLLTELNRNLPTTNSKSLKQISNNVESSPEKNPEKSKIIVSLEGSKKFTNSNPKHKLKNEKKKNLTSTENFIGKKRNILSDEKTVTHIEIKKQKPLFKIVDEKILENIKQNNDIDINKRININNINNIDNIGNKNTNFNNDNVNFNNRYKIEIDEVDLLHQTQEYKIEKLNYKYYINIEIENKLNDLYFIK